MLSLNIKSDFSDYYDDLKSDAGIVTYNRFLSDCKQRGTALKFLRDIGVNTIEIKPINSFYRVDGNVVVYTNPKGHNGLGKKVMSVDQALMTYGSCIASKCYENCTNVVKYLHIGKRRFALYYNNANPLTLDSGTVSSIVELNNDYNRLIGLPIFSIDYISVDNIMLATDFNEVENLSRLGFQNIMSDSEVIEEIVQSLIVYNKV